ncbi:MAG TPA: hypothetical protein VL859_03990 [Flavobacterium sp.]|nr:hypothetical protein [Flavobacterium sp.]
MKIDLMQKLRLDKDLNEVLEMFPKLKLFEKDKKKSLCGEIAIFDTAGNYVDSFTIKVAVPKNYPHGFPLLFETGNKFEHTPDRHISEDGSCCVCSLQESDLISQKGISIKDFFLRYVIPYLANQLYFESEEEWVNGDYEHGVCGILQYYLELFKMDDIEEVINLLSFFNTQKMNRNDNCFCGKKEKLKRCHLKTYTIIKDLSKRRIEYDILALKWLFKKQLKLKN